MLRTYDINFTIFRHCTIPCPTQAPVECTSTTIVQNSSVHLANRYAAVTSKHLNVPHVPYGVGGSSVLSKYLKFRYVSQNI